MNKNLLIGRHGVMERQKARPLWQEIVIGAAWMAGVWALVTVLFLLAP